MDTPGARGSRQGRALDVHVAARAHAPAGRLRDPRTRCSPRDLRDVRRRAPVKKRLDLLLVERGLAESRAQAQALVMAGLVPGYDKPGQQVAEDAELTVDSPPPYVSRAGYKLANALDAFGVDVNGLDCCDVGASTGGFSDVLLQRGAARVI